MRSVKWVDGCYLSSSWLCSKTLIAKHTQPQSQPSRAALPALFKQKGALETLRPSTGEAWGGQGVHFADSEDNWPHRTQLAANLEAFLEEKLRIADR